MAVGLDARFPLPTPDRGKAGQVHQKAKSVLKYTILHCFHVGCPRTGENAEDCTQASTLSKAHVVSCCCANCSREFLKLNIALVRKASPYLLYIRSAVLSSHTTRSSAYENAHQAEEAHVMALTMPHSTLKRPSRQRSCAYCACRNEHATEQKPQALAAGLFKVSAKSSVV